MLPLAVFSLLLAASVTDAGVSFVRWGRTECPTGSHALYKGYMAGSYYSIGGSGANYLCMLEKPQFVRGIPGRQAYSGMLFGVELHYRASYKNLFSNENIPGGTLHNQDMPCVRCYVADSTDLMVVPGAQDCAKTGYELQYKGFLVSEGHSVARQRTEFVCLDEAPEGVTGGTAGNSNAVIYPVEIGCGSLPCNPYVDGMEATCAVCTF